MDRCKLSYIFMFGGGFWNSFFVVFLLYFFLGDMWLMDWIWFYLSSNNMDIKVIFGECWEIVL